MRRKRERTVRGATVLPAAPPMSVVRNTLNIYSDYSYIKLTHTVYTAEAPTTLRKGGASE